jgi:hypothetical protein
LGGGGSASYSTSKYDVLQPKGGEALPYISDYSDFVAWKYTNNETPLQGGFQKFIEMVMISKSISYTEIHSKIVAMVTGKGSTNIAGLVKGTQTYTDYLAAVGYVYATAVGKGKTLEVPFVFWTQGESDSQSTSYSDYYAAQNQLITDLNTDMKAITGQTKNIPLISYQLNYHSRADKIAKAHLDAGINNPLFICAVPSYILDVYSADGVHFTPAYRRILGAYYGLAGMRWTINGSKFLPLYPIQFTVTGNNLKIKYHVPVGPIAFDTTDVSDPGNYGFDIKSSAGTSLTLSNIQIIGQDTVSIDCSASPAGGTFTYAHSLTDSYVQDDGTKKRQSGRGCLRDSQGEIYKIDTYKLHNYAMASYVPII